jgi:hypothetical protein
MRMSQIRQPVITTEGDEMELSGLVTTDQSFRYRSLRICRLEGWNSSYPRSEHTDLGHPLWWELRDSRSERVAGLPISLQIISLFGLR